MASVDRIEIYLADIRIYRRKRQARLEPAAEIWR